MDSAVTQINMLVVLPTITINDTDTDGIVVTSSVDLDQGMAGQQNTITVAGEGTFVDDGVGNVTFTPEPTFIGTSTIMYTVNDNDGATSMVGAISVRVNDPPVAVADAAVTQVNTLTTVAVIANDTDSDGMINAATVDLDPGTMGQQNSVTVPGQGTFMDNGAGNVTFTPVAGFIDTSAIMYTVNDNDGATSAPEAISIRVNAPPVAADDTTVTSIDVPVTLMVTGNDTDSDGLIATGSVDLDPTAAGQQNTLTVVGEGTFTHNGSGMITFTPESGFTGVPTITLRWTTMMALPPPQRRSR